MTTRGWRYIAERLDGNGGGSVIDLDLPLEDVEITKTLSGADSIDATISPVYKRLMGPDGLPILKPWSTAVYAEYDGDIRAAGILSDSPAEGPKLALDFVGFVGYAKDMPYTGAGWYGVQVDPLEVVRFIWNHIQSQPGGNIGLQVSTLATSVRVGTQLTEAEYDSQEGPYTYQSGPYKLADYQDHDLLSNINTLASDTPFDFTERHVWDGDIIRHHLDFGYPKIGRRQENLRFTLGENIFTSPGIDLSGDDYASSVLVCGAGDGPAMVRFLYPAAPVDGLRRIAVVSDPSITNLNTAVSRGKAELAWRKSLAEVTEIEVHDHPHAPLGAVSVGDEIYLGARDDWAEFTGWVRVTQISYKPDTNTAVYTISRSDKLTS